MARVKVAPVRGVFIYGKGKAAKPGDVFQLEAAEAEPLIEAGALVAVATSKAAPKPKRNAANDGSGKGSEPEAPSFTVSTSGEG